MSESSLNNPHDKFVRHFLSDLENVRSLVALQLPPQVLAMMKLETIEPAKQSFVNKVLKDDLSDLVFTVQLQSGTEALLVLLFEHKSQPDRMTAFQVLRYIVDVLDERHRNGKPLCCVLPIVLYHGPRKWKVAKSMLALVDVPEPLKQYVPQFTMPLIDLSQYSDDDLRGESLFLATMSLLKYVQRAELPQRLPEIFKLYCRLLPPATALESFEAVLRYLVGGTDQISREELHEVVNQTLYAEGESLMPTIAEQLKEEGRVEGIQTGIQKGIEKGVEKGELIGQIRTLQGVLGETVVSRDELMKADTHQLRQTATDLASRVSKR